VTLQQSAKQCKRLDEENNQLVDVYNRLVDKCIEMRTDSLGAHR